MTSRLLATLIALAMVAAACGSAGDEPTDDPAPSHTTPANLTSDSLAYNPEVPDDGFDLEETRQGESAEAEDAILVEEQSAIEEGAPAETTVETPVPLIPPPDPDLPEDALDDGWPLQPTYPDTEKTVPPPRD